MVHRDLVKYWSFTCGDAYKHRNAFGEGYSVYPHGGLPRLAMQIEKGGTRIGRESNKPAPPIHEVDMAVSLPMSALH